jgi:simple sugar transport system ATP-binding protein
MSIAENVTLSVPDRVPARGMGGRLGFLSLTAASHFARGMIESLDINATGADQPVTDLSGGNQQKVVLARALASDPAVLVLVHPACGVDVASKAQIFALISAVAQRGTAVLIVSDELDELEVCDRILVMRQGRLTREFTRPYSPRALIGEMEGAAA